MKEKRILVIEDDEHHAYMLKRTLEEEKYEVFVANEGEKGVRLAKEKRPQVILLDIIMATEYEGIEVLEEIKKFAPEIEIIMLTAKDDIKTAVKAMKEGAFNYITKSFQPDELKVIVEKAFKYHDLKVELDKKIIELGSLFLVTEKFLEEELGVEKVLYVIDDLETFFQCEIGTLTIIEDGKPIIKAGIGIPEDIEKKILGQEIEFKGLLNIIEQKNVEIIKDFNQDPLYHLLKEQGVIKGKKEIQSILLIPLKGDEFKGIISIYTTHHHEVLVENRLFIQELAKHLKSFTHHIEAVIKAKTYGAKLAIAEKEAELGKVISGIAHTISPTIALLEEAFNTQDKELGQRQLQRLRNICEDLRTYQSSTMMEYNLAPCKIEELVEEVLSDYNSTFKRYKINIVPDIIQTDVKIKLDKDKIKDVFNELISNAIDAINTKQQGKGELAISLSVDKSNNNIQILFKDNGCGIPEGNKKDIFKEWKTTKQGGTGLGLPMAKRVVERHGGKLELVDTQYGTDDSGTTFKIELPIEKGE